MYERFLEGDLIVSEGKGLGLEYHLRVIGKEGPQFKVLKAVGICDAELAWDTSIPVSDWSVEPDTKPYCGLCLLLAERRGLC